MKGYFEGLGKLGFGLMRLPRLEDGSIDVEQTKKMTDLFLDAGMNYFDTAFVYEGSEDACRQALVDRYPRDRYFLATKLNAWMMCNDAESAKQQFFKSLERTGAGYFDSYLLHALKRENIERYDEYGIWDFVKEQKEKGLIRHLGFSFHGDPEMLEGLLQKHPEVEFVQLQLNYADWESPSVTSRRNYEVCRKYGKYVVVMEPVKGGLLANPPEPVRKLFKEAEPDMSCASWAIRFAASLEGVAVVLSGMSKIDQMKDNLSYMKDFKPLDEKEKAVIAKAQEEMGKIFQIPCTGCHYCTPGCPVGMPIPDIFAAMNKKLLFGNDEDAKRSYRMSTEGKSKASDCLQCGQCENACPQHLTIIEYLKQCAAALE
ncbi:MAG: aldo/keto reductase [Oscillospiraceae bacterium]|jgi:predicted aldo/keto reductase-like oxidoreductase